MFLEDEEQYRRNDTHYNARRHTDIRLVVSDRSARYEIEHFIRESVREILVEFPDKRTVIVAPSRIEHVDYDIDQNGFQKGKRYRRVSPYRSRAVNLRRVVYVFRKTLDKRPREEDIYRSAARYIRYRKRKQSVEPVYLAV